MNKTGARGATAEPMRLESKRERRRGASGRAAALRRAPSDSDCSGETASLSADSGDRAPRPQPQPPRSGKTRSRRRGSEWEVLEGLKDGQRFEKRPDVFNGYLHKKRKWPLKGWHKRFFVVDGGILVYARSPTDVARGRLHGSVDVGLSVISAKQRRRRIDIDADEFIYHLRAKTPELFRTWLNVLKAHRLYRQHLLTFGVRESAPKIHPPLDDLPPTDTSSRTSHTSQESSLICSSDFLDIPDKYPKNILSDLDSTSCYYTTLNSLNWAEENTQKSGLIPLTFEPLETKAGGVKFNEVLYHNHRSLCSMHCVARRLTTIDLNMQKSPDVSLGISDAERQIISTDLDLNSLRGTDPLLSDVKKFRGINSTSSKSTSNIIGKRRKFLFLNGKVEPTAAYYFFARKNMQSRSDSKESPMKKSKKSTNLVKYKNMMDEPTLKRPLSKCMLLGKYKLNASKYSDTMKAENRTVACEPVPKENSEVQVTIYDKEHKSLQDVMTVSDYDKITERLMASLFDSRKDTPKGDKVKHYINKVVQDLYDDKLIQDTHPVKALFRSLLEYWLKNTSIAPIQCVMTHSQSVGRQSNKFFTKDENISRAYIGSVNKGTQLHGLSDLIVQYRIHKKANPNRAVTRMEKKKPPKCSSPTRDTESFEKERRIQELEKLLKNTVYICETARSTHTRDEDIKITKTLIDNLEKFSRKSDINNSDDDKNDTSNSSTEKIQETINRLISDTSLPRDIAKEFLNAYLGVLINDGSKSITNTSSLSSDHSLASLKNIVCDVQAESVLKQVSKSITTFKQDAAKVKSNADLKSMDPGQLYLKDVLDKITAIFSKVKRMDDRSWKTEPSNNNVKDNIDNIETKDELGRSVKEYPMKNLIYENLDENSLVIDLSRYGLENISMYNDPAVKGMMSITIKLKEKASNIGESNTTHLCLKFSDSTRINPEIKNEKWFSYLHTKDIHSKEVLNKDISGHKTLKDFTTEFDLKHYLSNSDATSKAYRIVHESEHSLDLSFISDSTYQLEPETKICNDNDDTQSCYIMSFKKGSLATKFQSKKKVRLKEYKGIVLSSGSGSPTRSPELSVFEKPAPRVIDEKFILLLLENLTLLSKGLPSLYKDINNLYVKLRKKHEKVLKNCGTVQGLSLLGKIYNEDNQVCPKDATTQYDAENTKTDRNIKEVSTNTSNISTRVDENVSAMDLIRSNRDTQTEDSRIDTARKLSSRNNFYVPAVARTDLAVNPKYCDPIEQATSNPKWIRNTRECSISTVIKCVIDNEQENRTHPLHKPITYDKPLRKLPKLTEEGKEFTLLTPTIKVSTQSQTERNLLLFIKDKMLEKDFKVYSLFVKNRYEHARSSSMTNSTMDVEDSDELNTLYRCSSTPSYSSGLISPSAVPLRGPKAGFVSGTPGGRLASWIIESGGPLENASCELGQAQLSVQQLQRLLDTLELQQQVHHDTDVSIEGASPNVKKDRRKFGLRKKKSNSKCASVELQPPHIDPSSSHMALSALTAPPSPGGGASSAPNSAASLPIACAAARPQSLPGADTLATSQGPASLTSLTPDHQLREDFTVLAKDLVASLKSIVSTLVCERGRLRAAMDAAETATSPSGAVMVALRTNLTSALQQNSELRSRLCRIHDASDLAEVSSVGPNSDPQATRQFQQSLSYSSSCVSASEFFDAEEHEDDLKPAEILEADEAGVIELDGDSSSEAGSLSSEEGSASSDNSDVLSAEQVTLRLRESESSPVRSSTGGGPRGWSRRTRLPAPRPTPGGPSLWNLLYKNIGKDLSQISMPVTINEPLNMLQRLCEELEYSELLDAAAECGSAAERMALVAAFAVSAYASSAHRAASKPFNPLLAETYECIRDDKGFKFVAEQVSHHPPISACHAESSRWCFWQEARIKTKFWGKSMEFQPTGRVHVRLASTGDHYSWNKVTTCVHNLFGGQRWVDQYGDMHITCHGTDISCKLNFIKASSWSSSRHEVRGAVSGGGARLRLAGRWSEALYAGDPPAARCLWRTGAMPPEHELYYGFTRFAMELNEMEPGMRDLLPHTDTRLRPDQRALEEGDVEAAEQHKLQLEQRQRERRRGSPDHSPAWFRKSLEGGEETWVFSGEYWAARDAAFPRSHAPSIW